MLPANVVNGTISGSATTLTIPQGEVESASLTVTRTTGTTAAVTVDIGNPLPGLPAQHQGYALTRSVGLPLQIIAPIEDTPLEPPLEMGICKIGDILAPGESCTYPGTDAVFSVRDDGKSQWNIPELPSWLQFLNKVSIGGSMSVSATVNGVDYNFKAKSISNNSWKIEEVGDDVSQEPVTPITPEPPEDTEIPPTLNVTTTAPITEATLHGGVITLNLSSGALRVPFSLE